MAGLDQAVKEMQVLVEKHENLCVEKIGEDETELIACVKEISHRHHLLAHHYKKANSHSNHPFLTPDKKLAKAHVSSDSSLSSGGGISDTTPVEGSESSLLSSDSDSDSCNSSPVERLTSLASGKMLKHEIVNVGTEVSEMGGEYEMLMRLSDYEKELKASKEKLASAEEEIAKLESKMSSMEAHLVSAENRIRLHEAYNEEENRKSLNLHSQIVVLEGRLETEKKQVEELQERVKDRDFTIQRLNADLQDASGSFALEKWQLESSVSKLQQQCELLESQKIETVEKQEALQISWQENLDLVKKELSEKKSAVDALNKVLDDLKRNYDTLKAEKDGVDAKLQTLNADLSLRYDKIQYLEGSLLELKSENERLNAEADCANKLANEVKSQNLELKCENERLNAEADRANKLATEVESRNLELVKEVEMQAVMISETADGKREAIKQLCFSLDYFRNAYQELRIHKQPTAMVA